MSRYRESGSFTSRSFVHDQCNYACNPSGWQTLATVPGFGEGRKRTMTDEIISAFHTRSAKGEVFMNPLLMTDVMAKLDVQGIGLHMQIKPQYCPNGNLHQYRWENGLHISEDSSHSAFRGLDGEPCSGVFISHEDVSSAMTEVSTRVLNNIGMPNGNLSESIAEYAQVARLFSTRTLDTISRITNPDFFVKARSVAETWLMFRYGIMPLVNDVEAIVKGLKKTNGPVRQTARAALILTDTKSVTIQFNRAGFCTENTTASMTDVVNIRGMALTEYQATTLSNIGISPKGVLLLPWELTNYSFVVDWFANVGDFFGSNLPAFGFNNRGSCLVVDRFSTCQLTSGGVISVPDHGWTLESQSSGSLLRTQRRKTRGALSAPGLVIKSDFKFDHFTRAADAAALLGLVLLNFRSELERAGRKSAKPFKMGQLIRFN